MTEQNHALLINNTIAGIQAGDNVCLIFFWNAEGLRHEVQPIGENE